MSENNIMCEWLQNIFVYSLSLLFISLFPSLSIYLFTLRKWTFPWALSGKLIIWAKCVTLTVLAKILRKIDKYFSFVKSNLRESSFTYLRHFVTFLFFYFQLVIFKHQSYCFEEAIGFDVKASFVSCAVSRLIRWYNKRILRKGYWVPRDFSWIENKLFSLKNNLTSRQSKTRKLRVRESEIELTLGPRVWDFNVLSCLLPKTTNKLLL